MTNLRNTCTTLTLVAAAAVLTAGLATGAAAQNLQGPDGESVLHAGQTLVLKGTGFGAGPGERAAAAPDSTGPRVELGDAAEYNACERLVMQAVTTWTDSEIVLTVNPGPFGPEEPVWAYITGFEGGDGMVLESAQVGKPDAPAEPAESVGPGQPGQPIHD